METPIVEKKKKKEYDKSLPSFTKGEEIFSAVTHIVGGGFAIIFLLVGVIFAHQNPFISMVFA